MDAGEFPGMPEASALSLEAERYLAAKDDVLEAQDFLKEGAIELANAFIKAKKVSIKINGRVIKFSQDLKTLIKVITPREP